MLVIEAVPLSITERPGQRELQIFRSKCRFRISRYNSWNTWVSTFSNLYNSLLGSKTICIYPLMKRPLDLKIICSGCIKGPWGHLPPIGGSAPPTCPPIERKKWSKSVIFGKFFDFCPLRNAFCPLDAPPPQKKKNSGAATDYNNGLIHFKSRLDWTNLSFSKQMLFNHP